MTCPPYTPVPDPLAFLKLIHLLREAIQANTESEDDMFGLIESEEGSIFAGDATRYPLQFGHSEPAELWVALRGKSGEQG